MPEVRVLSLTQPWASLLVGGKKQWETRSFRIPKSLLGKRIYIQASKGFPKWAKECCSDTPFVQNLAALGVLNADALPTGAIIGSVIFTECKRTEEVYPHLGPTEQEYGDYGKGRFAWRAIDPIVLPSPIPARGALGFWRFNLAEEFVCRP